jgi:hypothetical protein
LTQKTRREGCLDETCSDIELSECGTDAEHPYGPLGDRAGEIRRADARGAGRTRNHIAYRLCNERCDDDHEGRDDDARHEVEYDLLEENIHLLETKYLKGSEQEHNHDEPSNEFTEKMSCVQMEARIADRIVEARFPEGFVKTENVRDLFYNAPDNDANNPAENEDDRRDEDGWQELDDRIPELAERGLEDTR